MSEENAIQEYLLTNIYFKEINNELCQQLQIPEKLREECRPLLYVQRELIEIMIQSIRVKYRRFGYRSFGSYGIRASIDKFNRWRNKRLRP